MLHKIAIATLLAAAVVLGASDPCRNIGPEIVSAAEMRACINAGGGGAAPASVFAGIPLRINPVDQTLEPLSPALYARYRRSVANAPPLDSLRGRRLVSMDGADALGMQGRLPAADTVTLRFADGDEATLPIQAFFADPRTGAIRSLSSAAQVWGETQPAAVRAIAPTPEAHARLAASSDGAALLARLAASEAEPTPAQLSFGTALCVRFGEQCRAPLDQGRRPLSSLQSFDGTRTLASYWADPASGVRGVTVHADRLADASEGDAAALFAHAVALDACRAAPWLVLDTPASTPKGAEHAGSIVDKTADALRYGFARQMCAPHFRLGATAATAHGVAAVDSVAEAAGDKSASVGGKETRRALRPEHERPVRSAGEHRAVQSLLPHIRGGATLTAAADGSVGFVRATNNALRPLASRSYGEIANGELLCPGGPGGDEGCVCEYAVQPVAVCTERLADGFCATTFGYRAHLDGPIEVPANSPENHVCGRGPVLRCGFDEAVVDEARSMPTPSLFTDTGGDLSPPETHFRVVWDCCDGTTDAGCTDHGVSHIAWRVADIFDVHEAQANGGAACEGC